MKSQNKDMKKNPVIKSICTTLACMVTSSVFALDDRFEEPHPQEDPQPKEVKRPDLVPIGIKLNFDHIAYGNRYYGASVTVANFGTADAEFLPNLFHCRIGYKVLASTDPVNCPVGSLHYGNQGPIYFNSLKVMEIADFGAYYFGTPDFAMPVIVTAAEIFLVVDHLWSHWSPDQNWENDTGAGLVGDVTELDEKNNVLRCTILRFADLLDPTPTEPVESKPILKVRGK